jgi:hypothetical protein
MKKQLILGEITIVLFAIIASMISYYYFIQGNNNNNNEIIQIIKRNPPPPFHVPYNFSLNKKVNSHRVLAKGRLISIGDVHGDAQGLKMVLKNAKLIDGAFNWIGGNSVLVQTGDMCDRGDESVEVMRLLGSLQKQALEVGGRVIVVLGNHELMNLSDDFRFAFPVENEYFGGTLKHRRKAYSKNGEFGTWLRSLPVSVVVDREGVDSDTGSVLFVHGGLHPQILHYVASQHQGGSSKSTTTSLDYLQLLNSQAHSMLKSSDSRKLEEFSQNQVLFGEHGPLWNRFFALKKDESAVCSALMETLQLVNAGKMVVGHSVQAEGVAKARCGGRLVLADVGFAPYYGAARGGVEHFKDGRVEMIWGEEEEYGK